METKIENKIYKSEKKESKHLTKEYEYENENENENENDINNEDIYENNLFSQITNLIKNSKERLCWHEYFMSIALLASCRSPCQRLNVGCVIVKDKRIISMGYNGFISGAEHKRFIRDGHEKATVHSEINAITDCAKRGVSLNNSKIYITHYPCLDCFKSIASSGIKNIIYLDDYRNDKLVEELNKDINIPITKLK